MPRDQAAANQLASPHLAWPHHRAALSAAPLCGVRWSAALGQAVAIGRRASQAAVFTGWTVPRGVLVCGTLQEAYFARLGTCVKGLETRRVTSRYISPSREISST